MIIFMSDIFCVTNRALCEENFLVRLERIAKVHPAGIILREKDLPEEEYEALARQVLEICHANGVECILHTFVSVALRLGVDAIHLSLPVLRQMSAQEKKQFNVIGASCHSVEDALEAQQQGCSYITAGHIFTTDLQKGIGTSRFGVSTAGLPECEACRYTAFGGISKKNMPYVRSAGAAGGCGTSEFMTCENPQQLVDELG